MKTRIAAIASAAVLVVGAGTAYALTTNVQEPAPVEMPTVSIPTPTETAVTDDPAGPTPVKEATADYITENDDAGYLAEVEKRTWRVTVLDQFSDAELIDMGREGCKQISEGVKFEDLRLVEGEKYDTGAWRDTSAIFNSALLNYCPQLMTIPPK